MKVVSQEDVRKVAAELYALGVADTGFRNVKFDSLKPEAQVRWIEQVEMVLGKLGVDYETDDSRL